MVHDFQIDHWIDNCQDHENSWFGGFLLEALDGHGHLSWRPELPVLDQKYQQLDHAKIPEIVVLNDEEYRKMTTEDLVKRLDRNSIIITSVESRYKELSDFDFKKLIFFPYDHWFLNIIGLRKLNIKIKKNSGNRVFNFLNRRWQPGRLHMIEYIFRTHPELLDTGYVTAGLFSYYKDHPKIQKDTEFLEFYDHHKMRDVIEHNNFVINDIPVTSNTKNFIHLAQTVPGLICIQVETFGPNANDIGFNLNLTEKSMMAIATGQIPIIIGQEPHLLKKYLKDQGFDIFDDIIDQSYDAEPDYLRRCELAIELNLNYLTGKDQLPDLTQRLDRNQNYLLTTWTNQILRNLVDNVLQLKSMPPPEID